MKAELLYRSGCKLGEGPLWDDRNGRLLLIDIDGGAMHAYDWRTGRETVVPTNQKIGCLALGESGAVYAGLTDGLYRLTDGGWVLAHEPQALTGERFNDGKVGPDGALYIGTMQNRGVGASLYRFSNGRYTPLISDARISNGLDWSMDHKTLWYVDSGFRTLDEYAFEPESLTFRRRVIQSPEGSALGCPDGMCIDREDMLWFACWEGGRVVRYDPRLNREIEVIHVPVRRTTSCAFAGDDLSTLVITTAVSSNPEIRAQEPLAGATFCVKTNTKGRAPFRMAD